MELGQFYDISPLISDRLAVFPGDQSFQRQVAMDFERGDHLALSSIVSSVHMGAHVDAPNHYHSQGVGIDQRNLNFYLGSCQVIHVQVERGERILLDHLQGKKIVAPRVLFRTDSFPNPNRWNGDFNSLSPELVDRLAELEVILVGLDTPSVDPEQDKALESHQAIYRHDMAILEGVVLTGVPEGVYTLIALPLRMEQLDASPVRAILVRNFAPSFAKEASV